MFKGMSDPRSSLVGSPESVSTGVGRALAGLGLVMLQACFSTTTPPAPNDSGTVTPEASTFADVVVAPEAEVEGAQADASIVVAHYEPFVGP
jgi:hypothetical protein